MQERVWHSGVVSIRKVWGHACACCERALGLRALTGEPTKNNMNRGACYSSGPNHGPCFHRSCDCACACKCETVLLKFPEAFVHLCVHCSTLVLGRLALELRLCMCVLASLWSNACELAKRICNPGTVNSIVLSRACLCRTGIRTYARTYVRT